MQQSVEGRKQQIVHQLQCHTAQHSTAQHSTAQHSTARCSACGSSRGFCSLGQDKKCEQYAFQAPGTHVPVCDTVDHVLA